MIGLIKAGRAWDCESILYRHSRLLAVYVAAKEDFGGEVVGIATKVAPRCICTLGISLACAFGIFEGHSRRGRQISLQMVVSHHVVAGI